MRSIIICVFIIIALQNSTHAVDAIKFDDFVTIDRGILMDLNRNEPINDRLSGGQLQCWNMLAWAHYTENFEVPLESIKLPHASNFKLFGPPLKLAEFLNDRLPYSLQYQATILGAEHLHESELIAIIKKHIDKEKPLLIYYLRNSSYHLATIIGYKKSDYQTKYSQILLKTTEQRGSRIMLASELLQLMDQSDNLEMLRSVKPDRRYFSIEAHFMLLQELVAQMHNFTFVTFKKKPQKSRYKAKSCCQLL
jgi:hypothetical protein